MAVFDHAMEFSHQQAETTQADHDSENVVDLGAVTGGGPPLRVTALVTTACTSNGSATVRVSLQHCATAVGSYVPVVESGAVPVASLVKGFSDLGRELALRRAAPFSETGLHHRRGRSHRGQVRRGRRVRMMTPVVLGACWATPAERSQVLKRCFGRGFRAFGIRGRCTRAALRSNPR